ncbi:hypothetical protein NPIL_523311 [Nephila pilipes]|uniref:Uncharacterized protein n=1 Tax=Nephila pilipes TaxID=299642 RepID=A0A8X6PY27_NEPPI|nr:hypothetical protein NPIL_523311 [Nephila pilipes]
MCPDECVLLNVDGLSGLLGASPLSRPLEPPRSGLFLQPVKPRRILFSCSRFHLLKSLDFAVPCFRPVPPLNFLSRDDVDFDFIYLCVWTLLLNYRFRPWTLWSRRLFLLCLPRKLCFGYSIV